jgi:hypothetical protein
MRLSKHLHKTFDRWSTKLDSYLPVVQASTMPISFRFIHTTDAKASEDDLCNVNRVGDNSFSLAYTYLSLTNAKYTNTVTVNSNGVLQWIRRAMDMLERDAEPLARMQIDFPLLPSIIFNVNELGSHYHAILDAVEFTVDNWPTKSTVQPKAAAAAVAVPATPAATAPAAPPPLRRQNWDTMSASTDSSMPSLISMNRAGVTTRSQLRQHLFLDEAMV